jgi:SCY1-like protein 1
MFDGNRTAGKDRLPLAKNALKKLKTIRHPHVLKYIDMVETDVSVYIVTERVKPLVVVMEEEAFGNTQQKEQWLIWGLHRVIVRAFVLHLMHSNEPYSISLR